MKTISHKISWGVLVGILILVGMFAFVPRSVVPQTNIPSSNTALPEVSPQNTLPVKELPQKSHLETKAPVRYLTLIVGSTNVRIPLSSRATLYDALSSAQENGILSFSGKEYQGLGFFVTDIGTLHQDNGKYLVYFINGTEASTGVSSYIVNEGDTIVWKLQ